MQFHHPVSSAHMLNAHLNQPPFGELDGIPPHVDQHLTQPQGVPQKTVGKVRGHGEQQFKLLLLSAQAQCVGEVLKHMLHAKWHMLHFHLAGLHLGVVQDVVDDAQKILSRAVHLFNITSLLASQIRLQSKV